MTYTTQHLHLHLLTKSIKNVGSVVRKEKKRKLKVPLLLVSN